jgi:hypothetical protein
MKKNCFVCGIETESDFLSPALCDRHHDFSVLVAVTRRTGYEITVKNLEINYERLRFTPRFPVSDIAALLVETTLQQKPLEFGGDVV